MAEQQALVHAEQSTVTIFSREVRAVRLADGRIAAVFTDLVAALGLDRASQVRRLRDDEVLNEQLLFAAVQTDEGSQPMDVLTAWAIPAWLQGLQVSRLAADKRPAVLAFKREAADVLYRHFSQRQAQLSAPANLVPSEPITKPETPAIDAPPAAWLAFHKQMVAWLEWQEDIEDWRGYVESRLESHEEVLRLVPEILQRLGPEPLSPEHQQTVRNLIKRLHEVGGFAYPMIYAELGEHFHVAKYSDIPDTDWQAVLGWLRVRIEAAEKRAQGR